MTKELLRSLLLKYNIDAKSFSGNNTKEFFDFSTSDQFFQVHRKVRSVIRDLDDFTTLAHTIINQLDADNIIYSELLFSPQIFIGNGFSLSDIVPSLFNVFKTSPRKINLIIEFSRSREKSSAEEVFDDLLLLLDTDYGKIIKGISLGGDEVNYSANPFKDLFARARENGLQVIAHAGEWVGPHSVWEVIRDLKVQRIIHGISSIRDKSLINFLINNDIPLDVSISSNYATGAVNKQDIHPITFLNKLGVKLLLSTDMPGYFNVTMSSEVFTRRYYYHH
jgi:adenosine deaminase